MAKNVGTLGEKLIQSGVLEKLELKVPKKKRKRNFNKKKKQEAPQQKEG